MGGKIKDLNIDKLVKKDILRNIMVALVIHGNLDIMPDINNNKNQILQNLAALQLT